MIAVCVGIKNRAKHLQDYLIPSMLQCTDKEELSLSVFDCGSSDDLTGALEAWDGKLYYASKERAFTRTASLNRAIRQCDEEEIFICDADMSLPQDFVAQFRSNVSKEKTWFPICFSLAKGRPRQINLSYGWWRVNGYGMVGIHRSIFESIKGFNEAGYKRWGGEDNDLFNRTPNEKIRKRCEGLFHNWHESEHNKWTAPPQFQ